MSDEELVKRLRDAERHTKKDSLLELLFVDAADYIEHCHASHAVMAQEIKRLTLERDEAREDASVARQSLYEVCEQRNSAMAINAAPSAFDLKVMSERDAAERKVEKLREALEPFAERAQYYDPEEEDDDVEAWATKVSIGDLRRARAALAETENGK